MRAHFDCVGGFAIIGERFMEICDGDVFLYY